MQGSQKLTGHSRKAVTNPPRRKAVPTRRQVVTAQLQRRRADLFVQMG